LNRSVWEQRIKWFKQYLVLREARRVMGKGSGGRTELRKMGKRKSMKNEGRGLVFTVKLPVTTKPRKPPPRSTTSIATFINVRPSAR